MIFRQGRFLGLGALLYLPTAIFAPHGLAPLFALVTVAEVVCYRVRRGRLPPIRLEYLAVFGGLCVLGALSAAWSITPRQSLWLDWPITLTLLGGLWLTSTVVELDTEEFAFLSRMTVIGAVVGFVIFAVEAIWSVPITSFFRMLLYDQQIDRAAVTVNYLSRAAAAGALFVWPATIVFLRRKILLGAIAIFAAGTVLLAVSQNLASVTAVLVGLIAAAVAYLWRDRVLALFIGAVAVSVVVMPIIPRMLPDFRVLVRTVSYLPHSAYPRVLIWQTAADLIRERPISGFGLDSSRALVEGKQVVTYYLNKKGGGKRTMEKLPLHPHNGILQLWLEIGVFGALLGLAILISGLRAIARGIGDRWARPAAFGLFFSGYTIGCISFGIWQSWWLSAIWLAVALTAGTAGEAKSPAVAA